MALRFSLSNKKGFLKKIVCPENSDLKFISLSYLSAEKEMVIKESTGNEEWLWLLLSGKIVVEINNVCLGVMERKSVFEQKPISVYIPPGSDYILKVESFSEAVAVSALAEKKSSPRIISQEDVRVQRAGKLNYQRTIYSIISQDFPASKIIAGETIHDTGHWSCFPPHKHDVDQMPEESRHEEVYFFKCKPEKTGFGLMRIYDETQDIAFPILTNDLITIPRGYHPVAVIPEHTLYYFWALAGEKRPFQRHTHPDYLEYE
ncbi:MAG: 5-deoxy-glucuronate isomerase [Candidatus Omnitrophica bacterium]|nr:5-deoxy-glucuronate isomerase [Candidatus Omnitrophota bacterium]